MRRAEFIIFPFNRGGKFKKIKMIKKAWKFVLYLVSFIVLISIFLLWQNNDIVHTKINFKSEKVPNSFNNFRIVHISDLHNKEFGKNQKKLISEVSKAKPDVIVVTGDLIDSRHTNIEVAMEFIAGAIKLAPVYYVNGNHEAKSGVYEKLKIRLKAAGVKVLEDEVLEIEKNHEQIKLLGVRDPEFRFLDYIDNSNKGTLENTLENLNKNCNNEFKILLSHRPELMNIYSDNKIDLVFSGHAHGGQFRLPFLGGLVAPNQGFFPKYTSGIYKSKETSMVVSRGLGNSIIPIRIFNRPEIVIVTLNKR